MRIRTRITIACFFLILALVAIAGYAYFIIRGVELASEKATDSLEAAMMMGERENNHLAWAVLLSESILLGKPFSGELDPTRCALGRWYYEYVNSDDFKRQSPEIQKILQRLEQPHRELHQSAAKIAAILTATLSGISVTPESGADMVTSATKPIPEESFGEIRKIYDTEVRKHLADVRAILNEAHDSLSSEAMAIASESKQRGRDAIAAIILFSGIVVFIALFISWAIPRTILVPLNRVVAMAKDISDGAGDLTRRLQVASKDELGDLATWFNKFVGTLQGIMRNVAQASQEVASASEKFSVNAKEAADAVQQISETVQQVALGANEQSKDIASIAAAINQLAVAINRVADGAESQVKSLKIASNVIAGMKKSLDETMGILETVVSATQENSESATKGGEAIKNVIGSMQRIRDITGDVARRISELDSHSQEIGRILEVIDNIAEQTNLLALNAAVEAARAGEHGRGFAVVADEVRKLAERSSRETRAITDLIGSVRQATENAVNTINSATKEVEKGSVVAQETGKAFDSILAAAASAEELVKDLISSSKRLGEASLEVDKAMNEIEKIVEENMAATEEMTASIEEVRKAMDSTAAVSEENAAASEEVSSSTEEMTTSIQEISASSQSLARMARELQEAIGRFKV